MKYVLDSSVAFKWVVTEDLSDKAQQLRDDCENAVHEFLAPDIFEVEIAHALTRVLWADVMSTPPQLEPFAPLVPRAIAISSATRAGVYDCLYVALAERENCELITADDKLVKKLQPVFPFIVPLSSLP